MRIVIEWMSDGRPLVDAWNVVRGFLPALAVVFVLLLVTGCAHERVVIQPVEVKVPVVVVCAAQLPPDPRPIEGPAPDIFEAMKRALAEIELWRAWGLEARAAVTGCQPTQGGRK